MSISIREASKDDIGLLVTFRKKQLDDEEEHPDTDIDEALGRWFASVMEEGLLHQFILEQDGVPAATGAILQLRIPPSFFRPKGIIFYVTNMYTVPAYRGNGCAARILERLKQEAENRGCERLMLGASVWGRPVYEKFGFREYGDWMVMDLN